MSENIQYIYDTETKPNMTFIKSDIRFLYFKIHKINWNILKSEFGRTELIIEDVG